MSLFDFLHLRHHPVIGPAMNIVGVRIFGFICAFIDILCHHLHSLHLCSSLKASAEMLWLPQTPASSWTHLSFLDPGFFYPIIP
jgi:hypothetical protein